MKAAQSIRGQSLANEISVFPVDEDKLPKYGAIRVTVPCLCKAILIKGLYMLGWIPYPDEVICVQLNTTV